MAQFGAYTNSSSPAMRWYADLSYSRISNSVMRATITVTGEIANHVNSSYIGTGNAVTVYAMVNGVSQNTDIKAASAAWYGNSNNPRSCSFSFDITSDAAGTSIPVSYYVSASGYAAPAAVPTQSNSFATPAMLYVPSTPSLSASTVIMGQPVTISTNSPDASLTHTIDYYFGSVSGTIATGVSASVDWTTPLSLANQIPAALTGVGLIRCHTYHGSDYVGYKDVTIYLSVPDTAVPTIGNVTLTRIDNDVPSGWGIYVKSKSSVQVAFSASGAYGSTINGTTVQCTGSAYQQNTNPATFALAASGDVTITVEVSDTRGRMVGTSRTISVVDYSPPQISAVSTLRCDSAGAEADEGTYAKCTGTGTASSVSGKNVIAYKLYYRQYGTDTWTNAGAWTSGTAAVIGARNLSPDHTYDVKYEIADSFVTIYRVDLLSSAHYLVDAYEDSDSNQYFAVGKAAEKPNTAEFAHPVDAPAYRINGVDLIPIGYIFHWSPVDGQQIDLSTAEKVHAYFEFGTWKQIQDRFLLGAGSRAAGSNGGEESHTLTAAEVPSVELSAVGMTVLTKDGALQTDVTGGWSRGVGVWSNGSDGAVVTKGGNGSHNNMPPYLSVYIWQRIA